MLYNSEHKKDSYIIIVFCLMVISMAQFFWAIGFQVSYINVYFCFGSVSVATVLYFKFLKKDNYLDFDTIFIVIMLLVGYVYPVFLFSSRVPYVHFFGLDFDVGNIPLGTIVYTVGVQSYYLGSMRVGVAKKPIANIPLINTKFMLVSIVCLAGIFISLGAHEYFRNMYVGDAAIYRGGAVEQVMILLQVFAVVFIASEYYNYCIYRHYKISRVGFLIIIVIAAIMLSAGNRTLASGLLLPVIVLYAAFKKNVKVVGLISFIIVAIVMMYVVQLNRSGHKMQLTYNYSNLLSDLIIPARNNYLCIEYVNKFGLTYGGSMAGGLIGVVPSLEKVLVEYFELDRRKYGSAEIFTDYTLGRFPSVGLGTTLIADLYLSFGVLGVLVFMYCLGRFSRILSSYAVNRHYFYIVAYAAIASFAVYWARTTYFHPARLMLWSLLIAKINLMISSGRTGLFRR